METETLEKSTLLPIPHLRFSEYQSVWGKKKLGEISSGIGYGMNAAAIKYDGKHKYIRITDIAEQSGTFNPTPLTSPDGEIEDKFKLKIGDIVFTRTGASTGKAYLYDPKEGNLYFAGFLIRFHILNASPYFIFLCTFRKKYWNWVQTNSMRSGQPGLNAEEYKSLTLYLPSLPEQQKIASFFAVVDKKIQILNRKKELLETYKKGVMQQLFSQQIRFRDEDGENFSEWTWVGGNKLFDNISDKNHNSDLPILAITQDQGAIPRDLINYNITVTKQSIESYKVVQKGDFVISLRTFQGGIEYSDYHGICSPAYIVLRTNSDSVDRSFYKLYLKTPFYIQQLQKNLEGIRDGKMISYKYFSEIKLPYPSVKEQQKIADFLSAIDKKIAAVSQQIEKTLQFKKGLLQQMFV